MPPFLHDGACVCCCSAQESSRSPFAGLGNAKNCDLIVPSDGLGLDSACFDRLIPLQPCVGCCCCCLFTAGSLQTLCCCPSPANTEGRTRGRVSVAVATPSTIRAPECGNDKRGPWLSVISSISIYHHHAVTHSGRRCRFPRLIRWCFQVSRDVPSLAQQVPPHSSSPPRSHASAVAWAAQRVVKVRFATRRCDVGRWSEPGAGRSQLCSAGVPLLAPRFVISSFPSVANGKHVCACVRVHEDSWLGRGRGICQR